MPFHFAQDLDRHGKIVKGKEPKLAWRKNEAGQFEFIFQDSFKEMLEDFKLNYPNLITDDKKYLMIGLSTISVKGIDF